MDWSRTAAIKMEAVANQFLVSRDTDIVGENTIHVKSATNNVEDSIFRIKQNICSDRSMMTKLAQVVVTEKTKIDKLSNFYSVRVCGEVKALLERVGFLKPGQVAAEVSVVNDYSIYRGRLLEAKTSYQVKHVWNLDYDCLISAIRFVVPRVLHGSRRPLKPTRSFFLLSLCVNWTANSGWPDITKKWKVKGKNLVLLSSWLGGFVSLKRFLNYPCVIFNRTQAKAGKLKRRVVFGYPFIFALCEQLYLNPVLRFLKSSKTVIVEMTQSKISETLERLTPYHEYCLDFKRFDHTVDPFWIYLAFVLVKQHLVLTPDETSEFRNVLRYFAFSHMYHPELGVFVRNRGVPSGSGGSNLIDSLVNLFVICYILATCDSLDNVQDLVVHGDGIVLASKDALNMEQVCIRAKSLGMGITFDETLFFGPGITGTHFLGSNWHYCEPERDVTTMALQACVISTVWPWVKVSTDVVKGRIFTIFGYDRRLARWWNDVFGFGVLLGSVVYLYQEGQLFASRIASDRPRKPGYVIANSHPWRDR